MFGIYDEKRGNDLSILLYRTKGDNLLNTKKVLKGKKNIEIKFINQFLARRLELCVELFYRLHLDIQFVDPVD